MKVFELKTERLQVRPIVNNDLGWIHELLSLPETDRFNALGIPVDVDETRRWIDEWIEAMGEERVSSFTFAVIRTEDQAFVGLLGLKLAPEKYLRGEVWYKLHSDHWGHGYATELVKVLVDYCFAELALHRLQAGVAVDNAASIRVLEKVGFVREGRMRENLPLVSGMSDSFVYGRLRRD